MRNFYFDSYGLQEGDTGAASSLINSCSAIMGSIGMALASSGGDNFILVLGLLYLVIGVFVGGIWFLIIRKPFLKKAVDMEKKMLQ